MFTKVELTDSLILGFPIGLSTFGVEQIASVNNNKILKGDIVKPDTVVESVLSLLFAQEGFLGVSLDGNWGVTTKKNNPRYELLTILNDNRLSNISDLDLFKWGVGTVSGNNVRINWTQSSDDDFNSVNIYYDLGLSGIPASEFVKVATVKNRNAISYVHKGLASGTYRYYITFADIYGNEGNLSSPTTMSVTLVSEPTLTGDFSYIGKTVTFSPSASARVVTLKMFINYVFGVGLIDNINYSNPYCVGPYNANLVVDLQTGNLKIAVVGYDKYGNATAPIIDVVTVTDEVDDTLLAPVDVLTQTLAGGYFKLYYTDNNEIAGWTDLYIVIYNFDTSETTNFTITKPTSLPATINPSLLDGEFFIALKFVHGAIESELSELAALLIDGTYPAGANAFTVEVL